MIQMTGYREGNFVIILKDSFEHILNCLATQKFIGDFNADATDMTTEEIKELRRLNQKIIDDAWNMGMQLLNSPDKAKKEA